VVVPVSIPGKLGRTMSGSGLAPDGGVRGRQTFDEWLAAHTP